MLVVIIIIGILAAIALPSFLNQAAKAKQSEAKNYVGSVNRAQQTYRIEKNAFATDIESLQIGIPTETVDYRYEVAKDSNAATTLFTALPNDFTTLRSYAGGVLVSPVTGQSSAASCQTTSPSAAPPQVSLVGETAECATADNVMR